jgi:serine/threonine protein kinase
MEMKLSTSGSVYDLPFVSAGVSSMVYKFSETSVIKAPCGTDESLNQLATERAIYERLGSHPYITKVISIHKDMLVLERLQYPLRKRLRDLRDAEQLPAPKDILRWAAQIAQALEHAHSCGVLQVDIGPHNVLLDWAENINRRICTISAAQRAFRAPKYAGDETFTAI